MPKHHVIVASLVVVALFGAVACSASDDPGDERAERAPDLALCPVTTRRGDCRAAGPEEVVPIASGGFLLPAAGFAVGADKFVAFSVRWGDGRILSIKSPHPWAFDAASTLPWDAATGATGATVRGSDVLYFVAKVEGARSLHMAKLEGGALVAPERVVVEGWEETPSWPQAVGLSDGRALLAFVAPQRRVLLGVDDGTGKRFHVEPLALPEPDLTGVLAHVGTTAAGSWVITYQVADASWRFRSHVILSSDEGRTWSAPEAGRLSPPGDISDAFPLARRDHGADIYYVARRKAQSSVYRRALAEDGTLGAEQPVTAGSVGDVSKPQPRRLPDGRIGLMLTLARSPTTKDLAFVVLDGDAP